MPSPAPSAAVTELVAELWRDFVATTPQAARIRELLVARGEQVHHDHVVLRTIAAPGVGLEAIGARLEVAGFAPRERYRFDQAHLRARYWQHGDPNAPRVFVVELDAGALSAGAQAILERLLAQAPRGAGARRGWAWPGRPWAPTHAEYQALLGESEHAARVAALGIGVERCSLDVGALITFPDADALIAFLVEHAFRVEARGEGIAIRSELIPVRFADTIARIPSGSYELAVRSPPAGDRYRQLARAAARAPTPSMSRSNR